MPVPTSAMRLPESGVIRSSAARTLRSGSITSPRPACRAGAGSVQGGRMARMANLPATGSRRATLPEPPPRQGAAPRAAGKASESGGSGVAVGVADGPMLAGALGDGEGVALTDGGRCVANGPTHPAAKTTAAQNSATLVAARAGRPVNLRCGIVALDLRQRRALGEPLRHGTGGDRGPG